MIRISPLVLLALAAGCASSQGVAGVTGPPTRTVLATPGSGRNDVTITRDASTSRVPVPAAPARVWAALSEAYAEIGLPVTSVDQGSRTVMTNHRIRRIMGKGPATYFNCPGPYGNAASRDDVYLTVRTQVAPGESTGSVVHIGVNAVARSTTAANSVADCASNGELEKLIAGKITEHAAAP